MLAARVPENRRDFYQAHVLTMIQVHLDSLAMLEEYCAAKAALAAHDKPVALARAEQALLAVDRLFAALRKAEYGKWNGWYSGDVFVGMEGSRDLVRVMLAELKGEAPPPVRVKPDFYQKLYQYQIPFLENFPLMYPNAEPAPTR